MRLRADALAVVLVVAIALFIALAILVSADPRLTADVAVFQAARASAEPTLVALAGGPLDAIAEPGVVIALAAAVAIVLLRRRWWLPLFVLVTGLTFTAWFGVELKYVFDRPRPISDLDETITSSFPSGHARFGFFWTWLAFTIVTHVRLPDYARRSVIGVGLAGTAVSGLARVYIGAHWLTDVVAGWALSAAVFAAVTLLAIHLGDWHGRRLPNRVGRTLPREDTATGRPEPVAGDTPGAGDG